MPGPCAVAGRQTAQHAALRRCCGGSRIGHVFGLPLNVSLCLALLPSQECALMASLRHPNIVQVGMGGKGLFDYRAAGLPVLRCAAAARAGGCKKPVIML